MRGVSKRHFMLGSRFCPIHARSNPMATTQKALATASAALLLSAGLASAADLPSRNAPLRQIAPVFTWTGFYAGAQLGVGWQRDRLVEDCVIPCGLDTATGRSTGVLGGVHAGYNWQASAFVFGMEADFELTNLRHTTIYPASAPDSFGSSIRWQGSVRARAGYAFDRLLLYVTGGVAFADIKHTYNLTPPPGFASESDSDLRTGWTLGAGAEYAFTNNWSARVEYRYTDFGRRTDAPAIFGGAFNNRHRETQQAVRAGVSYRF